jgi:sRNA-binding carbon storage regulator CsrA
MPSNQLIELVQQLKKSGIKIGFTAPRSQMKIHLQDQDEVQFHIQDRNGNHDIENCKKPVIHFLHNKSVGDLIIPH